MSHLAVDTKVYIKAVEAADGENIPTFELLGGVDINDITDGFPVGTFTVGTETNAPNVVHALDDLIWNGGAIHGDVRVKCDEETLTKIRSIMAEGISIGYRTDKKLGSICPEIDVDEIVKNIERRFAYVGRAGTGFSSAMKKVLDDRRQYKATLLDSEGNTERKPVGLLTDEQLRSKSILLDSLSQLVDKQEENVDAEKERGITIKVGTTPHRAAIVAALKAINENIMVVGGHPDQLNPLCVDYCDYMFARPFRVPKSKRTNHNIGWDDGNGKGSRIRRRQGFGGYGKTSNKKHNYKGRK